MRRGSRIKRMRPRSRKSARKSARRRGTRRGSRKGARRDSRTVFTKKQLKDLLQIYGVRPNIYKIKGMRGGGVFDDLSAFGNDMWTKFSNKMYEVEDIPEMSIGKINSGVNRAAEIASKYGLSGPASGIRSTVSTVTGDNVKHAPLSVFQHPNMDAKH